MFYAKESVGYKHPTDIKYFGLVRNKKEKSKQRKFFRGVAEVVTRAVL